SIGRDRDPRIVAAAIARAGLADPVEAEAPVAGEEDPERGADRDALGVAGIDDDLPRGREFAVRERGRREEGERERDGAAREPLHSSAPGSSESGGATSGGEMWKTRRTKPEMSSKSE